MGPLLFTVFTTLVTAQCAVAATIRDSTTVIGTVSGATLAALNKTVDGRLHAAVPYSAPCFATVNNLTVGVDAAACSVVQSNYTDPFSRQGNFPATMFVRPVLTMPLSFDDANVGLMQAGMGDMPVYVGAVFVGFLQRL